MGNPYMTVTLGPDTDDPRALSQRIGRIETLLSAFQCVEADLPLLEGQRRVLMLATRMGIGEGGVALPFDASYNATDGTISVLGGRWREGDTGAWVDVDPTPATVGQFVYFKIEQDSASAVTSVSIEIKPSAYDDILLLSGTAPYPVLEARVLIAEVVDGVLRQDMNGNFTLGLRQIEGSVTRWPETVIGSIPPIPAA
jgi:hypothetical protein